MNPLRIKSGDTTLSIREDSGTITISDYDGCACFLFDEDTCISTINSLHRMLSNIIDRNAKEDSEKKSAIQHAE